MFFPRSGGFFQTASWARGALAIAPSIACQSQAIPPCLHIPPAPLSRVPQTIRSLPTPENTGEWHSDSRTVLSATPSTGFLSEGHRQCLRTPGEEQRTFGPLPVSACSPGPVFSSWRESGVPPVSRTLRTLPTIETSTRCPSPVEQYSIRGRGEYKIIHG